MRKCLVASALLIAMTGAAYASLEEGTVLEVTPDTIKIDQGGVKALTFIVSDQLLTNTVPDYPNGGFIGKITEVKKGDKIELASRLSNGKLFCTSLAQRPPSDAGVVTEVGRDTITIRNDKGTKVVYKVNQNLIDNNPEHLRYSPLYPSKFSEVTPRCRIEVTCQKRHGVTTIMEIEVKKEKEKVP